MEGGGIIYIAGMLLFLPFEMFITARAEWQRLLPIEQSLRLASHPPALVAVAVAGAADFGFLHAAGDELMALVNRPVDNGLALLIGGGLLAFAAAYWLVGVWQCIGARDPRRTVRAVFKLAFGGGLAVWLHRADFPWPDFFVVHGGTLIALWLVVTASVRCLLLTVSGGNALRLMMKALRQQNTQLRPARVRRFWFW